MRLWVRSLVLSLDSGVYCPALGRAQLFVLGRFLPDRPQFAMCDNKECTLTGIDPAGFEGRLHGNMRSLALSGELICRWRPPGLQ
jgi:hypothetical protein